MLFRCEHEEKDCVNNSKNGCTALNDTGWIKNQKCPFYISPEQYKRDLALIKERTGRGRR